MTETPNSVPTTESPLIPDPTRFKKFAPEPRAILRENPPKTLEFLTSVELIAASNPRRVDGKPPCGWSTPDVHSLEDAIMRGI